MELMMMVGVGVAMWWREKRRGDDVVAKLTVMRYVSGSRGTTKPDNES